jgi:hypothetical protein
MNYTTGGNVALEAVPRANVALEAVPREGTKPRPIYTIPSFLKRDFPFCEKKTSTILSLYRKSRH